MIEIYDRGNVHYYCLGLGQSHSSFKFESTGTEQASPREHSVSPPVALEALKGALKR